MAYASWNPIRELDLLRREFDRMFDGNWSLPFSRFSFLPGRAARAYPLMNVSEDQDHYYIEGLAPGIDPQSLKVSMVENQLVIEGEKKSTRQDVKQDAWHRSERSEGRFTRTLKLPAEVDAAKVEAQYRNGLLQITLPKAEAVKPRQITVNLA